MPRNSNPRTIHPLAIAESLTAQNAAVGALLMACESVLEANPGMREWTALRYTTDICRAAMYPEDEGEAP